MKITEENIWEETCKKNLDVLNSPLADKIISESPDGDWTPLHFFADWGIRQVLQHPSVAKVKNSGGWTPLHFFALQTKHSRYLKKWIKEKYPEFNLSDKQITYLDITKIIEASNAERFIFGCNKNDH